MDNYIAAKNFILKNARPLDMARWNYLFENADKQAVIKVLEAYQNPDGGFAHAIEPDCWNKESTPMQTWVATRIIREISLEDKNHPMIKGIIEYLASGDEFNGHRWNGLDTVATNNEYPHAPWWSCTQDYEKSYNPTASLIGFVLKYGQKDTKFYRLMCNLAKDSYRYFENSNPLESMHECACFIQLYEYMKECDCNDLFDMHQFKHLLQKQVKQLITYNTEVWDISYVCKPSLFISNKSSDFYLENKDICNFECEFIRKAQNEDGSWNVTWNWAEYPEEWAISKQWWKADIIINNMKYLQEFSM